MEAREIEGAARERALEGQVQHLTTQLTTTQQAGGAASVGGTLATGRAPLTRELWGNPKYLKEPKQNGTTSVSSSGRIAHV
eukprot:4920797-Amphidinium_carterae.1